MIARIAWLLCLVSLPPSAHADSLPLWEIGFGGGALRIPDYRGALDARTYPYPFAIPFYRGKYLRSDEEGVRGELLMSQRVKLDFSLDGNVPVKADDVAVRQGMPDLAPTFQIGPALNIKLWHSDQRQSSFIAFLPLRFAFELNFPELYHIGYTFSPRLNYNRKVNFMNGQWRLGLSVGLEYGSEAFHDYYYQVNPQYATTSRPVYDAQGGFAGYRSIFTFYRRFSDKWLSFYGRYDRIDNAVFDSSSLAARKDGMTVGFLLTWILFKSETMVEVRDWKYY